VKNKKNIGCGVILIIIAIVAAFWSLSIGLAADKGKINGLWVLAAVILGFIALGAIVLFNENKKK